MNIVLLHIFVFILAFYVSNTIWEYLQSDHQFYTIETSSGRIRGKLNHTLFDKKLFYSFRGIPFAKPPIQEFRFKVSIDKIWRINFNLFVHFFRRRK